MRLLSALKRLSSGGLNRETGLAMLLDRFTGEVEATLEEIDFDEVTIEDRVTFVECAVAWQVRRALACARFDLAVALVHYGEERIANLRDGAGSRQRRAE